MRSRSGEALVPNITLIEIDAVFSQQFAVLFLKRASVVVLLLSVDVSHDGIELTRAYRKCAIASLPRKTAVLPINGFDPLR
jgi:hypothetical protein